MPSLRARTSRPSYALLAEGLENLSDEDRDSDASQAEGSQAGVQRRAKTAQSDQGMNSASGDSGSEAGPRKGAQKGKGKQSADGRGKANPKKWASEDDDSGSEFEGPADEDEEEEDDELEAEGAIEAEEEEDTKEVDVAEDEDMDGSDIVPVSSPKPKPRAGAPFTGAPSHSKQATYVQSEANLIPQEYRDMVKSHSQIIAAIVRGKPKADDQPREYKTRALDPELLPSGPTTPFVSRLKREVKGREIPDVYYDERLHFAAGQDADKGARQMFGAQAVKAVPLLAPWQLWQGEGWWPEMAAGSGSASHTLPQDTPAAPATSKHKGKGKATHGVSGQADGAVPEPGWILRKDVRLGLERVGRYRVDEMKFLSESTAQPYLPASSKGTKASAKFNVGPHGKQTKIDLATFDSYPISKYNQAKQGFVLSTGGPIWGLDWCPYPDTKAEKYESTQYLALSTLPSIETKAAMGDKWSSDSRGCIQIWGATPPIVDEKGSTKDEGSARCELVLCVEGGPVHDLKWMPMGAWDDDATECVPKLGIIAGCQLDGSLSLYAVPHPRELRKQLKSPDGEPVYWVVDKPLLKLEIADAMCCCLEWINGSRIVCGMSNGFLAFWDVVDVLTNPQAEPPLPAMYFGAAQSIIRSIVVGRTPTHDKNNNVDYTRDPVYVVIGSHDATASIIDLRDPHQPYEIVQTRMPIQAVGWSNQNGNALMADPEHTALMFEPIGRSYSKTFHFAHHRGPVWAIATSDYHTMALSASSDGSVLLSNLHTGWFRRRGGGMMYNRLFEMDYDLHTGEYRMLDDFQPEEITLDGAAQKNSNRAKGTEHSLEGNPLVAKSGDWPVEVAVHKICWNNNNGLGRANWIASGTASGLCRIDIVRGRFLGGRVPAGLGPV